MRRTAWLTGILCALTAALGTPSTFAEKSTGNINFSVGQKRLNEDLSSFSRELEKQNSLGVEASLGGPSWPVYVAADLYLSTKDRNTGLGSADPDYDPNDPLRNIERLSTQELSFGVRKIWGDGGAGSGGTWAARPYIGAGVGLLRATFSRDDDRIFSDDRHSDTATGYWAGGGVIFRVGERFNIGLNARYSSANLEYGSPSREDLDVGGIHYGLLIGWGW